MKKEFIKGWGAMGLALLLVLYGGVVYRTGGFGLSFTFVLFCLMAAVPQLLLYGYRRLGSIATWLVIAAALPLLYYGAKDLATAVLGWAFCCGSPLAVTLFWPYVKRIKPLTVYALPAAGLIWLGGALAYCKLHFGSWDLYGITQRVTQRYGELLEQMKQFYLQLYNNTLPKQFEQLFAVVQEQAATIGFFMVTMVVYALMGVFFLAVYTADHSVPRQARWLGSWHSLIPGRGISWLYMGSYLLVIFFAKQNYQTYLAVFDLFGFFFVFTAVYRFLQFFRKKGIPPAGRALLVGLLFVLAYLSVGGALLSPYTMLLYVGWWITTTPRFRQIKP